MNLTDPTSSTTTREASGQATKTDTCSQHTRAGRRGGHEQRRAHSPQCRRPAPPRFPGVAPVPGQPILPKTPDDPIARVSSPDNGSAFTARRFRAKLAELGIRHRRGGYRDPESQAFIESWFGKLKEREVWLNQYETLDDARRGIGGYVDRYHQRPHSGLDYKTPNEVKEAWEDHQNIAA